MGACISHKKDIYREIDASKPHTVILDEADNKVKLPSDLNMNNLFVGKDHIVYASDDYEYLWSVGNNRYGQCGFRNQVMGEWNIEQFTPIHYFNRQNIKIRQICVNASSFNTFFISDEHKLYGCGKNSHWQLGIDGGLRVYEPIPIPAINHVLDAQSHQTKH